ncbi:DNA gyrase inhibitor YacG [Sphingosinithalassobacter portus]|uniref:DNA gyrase inhibitor YacG n=1 Tax=Stakelama portus TaxID=2676234 RepID=UPI000D6E6DD3|nr:DNA gyrase inhibitor YacG [Sphingosinithalassobacter portus]
MTRRDTCPVCGNPAAPDTKPFCSRGCKDRDLLQWLGEGYRIPGDPVDPEAQTGLDTPENRD